MIVWHLGKQNDSHLSEIVEDPITLQNKSYGDARQLKLA